MCTAWPGLDLVPLLGTGYEARSAYLHTGAQHIGLKWHHLICLFFQTIKSSKSEAGKDKIINHCCHFKVLTVHTLLYLKTHKNLRCYLILQIVTDAQELGEVTKCHTIMWKSYNAFSLPLG